MNLIPILRRKINTAKLLSRKALLAVMKVLYFPGKHYYCPCCDRTLRRFMHYDYQSIPSMNPTLFNEYFKQVQCPYCNSLPRHRIMAYFFRRHPYLIRNKKVVIFGMLQGEKTFFEKHNISYTFADLYAKEAHRKEDLTNLSFADASVDVLICHHVLEHVDNVEKALSEIRRVLSPKGIAILSVPMNRSLSGTLQREAFKTPELRRKYYGQTDHLRLFGRNFPCLLKQAGFKVHTIDGNHFPHAIRPVTGPAFTDINRLYVCHKIDIYP